MKSPVPKGRLIAPENTEMPSPPKILRVKNNVMLLQKRLEFGGKRNFAVVFFLCADVLNDRIQLRETDAEGAVFVLPCEKLLLWKRFMHPFGGASFDQLHRFRNGNRRRKRQKRMRVVIHTADLKRFHPIFSRNAADVRPQSRTNVRGQKGAPVLRREDAMEIRANVGHQGIQSSLRDSRNHSITFTQGLNPGLLSNVPSGPGYQNGAPWEEFKGKV